MNEDIGIEIKTENFNKIIDELNNMFIVPVTENIDGKKFGVFVNGMSKTENGSHICDSKGNVYKIDGNVIDDFYCGRAIVKHGDYYTYTDELGNNINLKAVYAKRFGNDLAPVRLEDESFGFNENYRYIDLNGNVLSPQAYLKASPFIDGIAIVLNLDGKWQYIDTSFNILDTIGKKNKPDFQRIKKIYKQMSWGRNISAESSLEIMYHTDAGYYISIINKQTGMNPAIDEFIWEIAKKYNIPLVGENSKERLLSLINNLKQIGDFYIPYGVLDIIPMEEKVEINRSRIRIIG